MAAPTFTAQQFLTAFLSLLPRGRIWSRDPDSVLSQALGTLMPTYERSTASAANLLVDAFPATTVELLPEWEATLGLPDPCAGESPTLEQRQAQVVARLIATGGQSIPYLTAFAAALGYTITITRFAPFRMGESAMGDPLDDESAAFRWQVNAPDTTVTYFRMGESAMGEPLAIWGNAVLECEMRRVAHAETEVLFSYG